MKHIGLALLMLLLRGLQASAQDPVATLFNFGQTTASSPFFGESAEPYAGLTQGTDGNFYGVTRLGGPALDGAIFRLTPSGVQTILHSFTGPDGKQPRGRLVQGNDGNFYGTAWAGGTSDNGTVFKITPAGDFTLLHSFAGTEGRAPEAGLVEDRDANDPVDKDKLYDFYGTTSGVNVAGTVFKITPDGTFTTLYTGMGGSYAPLLRKESGDFFGTTINEQNRGGIFRFRPGGPITFYPVVNSQGGLAVGPDDNLYGTTPRTIFRFTQGGLLTTLYEFKGGSDGSDPYAGLTLASDGNFYGTTQFGGERSLDHGTVFRITLDGVFTTLHSFGTGTFDGWIPRGQLLQATDGKLYGTASMGGRFTHGTVFTVPIEPPVPPPSGKLLGNPCDRPGGCAAAPIDIASGNNFQQITDYATAGFNTLGFTRYYNSLAAETGPTFATTLGMNWRGTFDRYIRILSASSLSVERADGRRLEFTLKANVWTPDTDVDLKLVQTNAGWDLTDADDTIEKYTIVNGTKAVLSQIWARSFYIQVLHYDQNNFLTEVTDGFNRSLKFSYNADHLLETLTTPDGPFTTYAYEASGSATGAPRDRLAAVDHPTTPMAKQSYIYDDPALPFGLTRIVENGDRYATWTYDGSKRVNSSELANGADRMTITYDGAGGGSAINALGQQETYRSVPLQGIPKLVQITRPPPGTTVGGIRVLTYDARGYLASETDWNGTRTDYLNDDRGQPTRIVEAAGTPQARVTTVTYDTTFHLPLEIDAPGRVVEFTYGPTGNLQKRIETDTASSGTRRVWEYNWVVGLLLSVQGPPSGRTIFTYDTSGALTSIINALLQTTRIIQHTGGGLPQIIIDPNGVVTQLDYDAQLRLRASTITTSAGPLTTRYDYDAAGNLLKTTLPDGSALTNNYDAAHRLTSTRNVFGQSISYTLDALGGRTGTTVTDTANVVKNTHGAGFDALGRIIRDIGGVGQTSGYGLDANGNPLAVIDPMGRVTQQEFDQFNRPIKSIDPAGGVAVTGYDAQDNPVRVQAQNGATTFYAYDGFGSLIQQVSPDTGTTVYRYDLNGNLIQTIDARGGVASYAYDALGRVIRRTYPLLSGGAGTSETSTVALGPGAVATTRTLGAASDVLAGSATAAMVSGASPYGVAVFSASQNGVVVSEAGVPAAPPLRQVRVFIDYRTGVPSGTGAIDINTGLAITNPGTTASALTYTLRDSVGAIIATGHGSLNGGAQFAKFVSELRDVAPDFAIPADFATAIRFGSLEIAGSQPVAVTALRLTVNQRGETLLTTTPVADLSAAPTTAPVSFPHLADGGGYDTTLILLNRSGAVAAGSFAVFDDGGAAITLRERGGAAASTFTYSIPPNGTFVFQTNGSLAAVGTGWVRLTPNPGTTAPVGAGVFGYSSGGILVTESGIPSATPTTKARIYVDKSNGHDNGLALANPGSAAINILVQAFEADGNTPVGVPAARAIPANGHLANLAGELVAGLPSDFTGVMEVSSSAPFVALTLRLLTNSRNDVLLTTFPVADANAVAPSPIVFPQIADGGGYATEFIFLNASTGSSSVALSLAGSSGEPLNTASLISYSYDESGHGFSSGWLTSVSDDVGTLSRSYDERGNLLAEARVNGSVPLRTVYSYDRANRVIAVVYPSGAVVSYARDAMGQAAGVSFSAPGAAAAVSVVANVSHEPFGPVSGFAYGNGVAAARRFDLDYRLMSLVDSGVQDLTYGYDAADNVRAIGNGMQAANSQSFNYDALDRLTEATGGYGALGYSYDQVGNRLRETRGASITDYAYKPASNQLLSISGSATQSFGYTPTGHTGSVRPYSADTAAAMVYGHQDRLTTFNLGGSRAGLYRYDAFGQRLFKSSPTGTTLYQYDQSGLLLEESDGTGKARVSYIYLDGRLVATFQHSDGKLYFVHTDRLSAPQAATDSAQAMSWTASYEPFGAASTSGAIVQNLRLPGQEFEQETGLYHNGFRDYVPALGRYLQSDPIGLAGGVNTYAYAGASPMSYIDPMGLDGIVVNFGVAAGSRTDEPIFSYRKTGQDWEGHSYGGLINAQISWAFLKDAQQAVFVSGSAESFGKANPNTSKSSGVFLGKGPSITYTNARKPSDLFGDSHVKEYELGVVQFSISSGTNPEGTKISTWTFSLGLGVGYMEYDSYSIPIVATPEFRHRQTK